MFLNKGEKTRGWRGNNEMETLKLRYICSTLQLFEITPYTLTTAKVPLMSEMAAEEQPS